MAESQATKPIPEAAIAAGIGLGVISRRASAERKLEAASIRATPPAAAPPPQPAEIPDSGGILETKDNTVLIVIVSVVVIAGLVGAGIWNIQRQKRQN